MKPQAVDQAEQRLRRATAAFGSLKQATNFDDAESAWSDFLLAASTIYSKLEQGVKGNGKSEAWFGKQKHARRKDPILRYLHFARNSDEHGIERVTERAHDSNFGPPKAFWEQEELEIRLLNPTTMEPVEGVTKAWAHGPHLKLVRANDSRYGDYVDPPEFEGEFPHHPILLAERAVPLLEALISEARRLI
jgi:hypothetical protein